VSISCFEGNCRRALTPPATACPRQTNVAGALVCADLEQCRSRAFLEESIRGLTPRASTSRRS
jgi:hypothetical protein